MKTLLVIAVASVLICGCKDEDFTPEAFPHFIVTFNNYDFSSGQYWVIISNASGTQTLDARRITRNGSVDFGDSFPNTVAVTFVSAPLHGTIFFQSYLYAEEKEWIRNKPSHEILGWANVIVDYPQGEYNHLTVETPSWAYGYSVFINDTMWNTVNWEDRLDESNTFTAYALLEGPSGDRCGWVVNQPFQLDETNTYSLLIDQPASNISITVTRPLDFLDLVGRRGEANLPFRLYRTYYSNDGVSFDLKVSAFPVTAYWLVGERQEAGYTYGVKQKTTTLPSTLSVPEGSVNATYDPSTKTYHIIALDGTPDAISGGWQKSESELIWNVYSTPLFSSISLPLIPDSIFSSLQISSDGMEPVFIGIEDYNPIQSYSEYIRMSTEIDGSYLSTCDRVYQYHKFSESNKSD